MTTTPPLALPNAQDGNRWLSTPALTELALGSVRRPIVVRPTTLQPPPTPLVDRLLAFGAPIPPLDILGVAYRVLTAVRQLERLRIVHGNLCTASFSVFSDAPQSVAQIFLTDLRYCAPIDGGTDPLPTASQIQLVPLIHPECASPERLRGYRRTLADDVWSCGCIMHDIALNTFNRDPITSPADAAQRLLERTGLPEYAQLVLRMLSSDPAQRPSISAVLRDGLFDRFRGPDTRPELAGEAPARTIDTIQDLASSVAALREYAHDNEKAWRRFPRAAGATDGSSPRLAALHCRAVSAVVRCASARRQEAPLDSSAILHAAQMAGNICAVYRLIQDDAPTRNVFIPAVIANTVIDFALRCSCSIADGSPLVAAVDMAGVIKEAFSKAAVQREFVAAIANDATVDRSADFGVAIASGVPWVLCNPHVGTLIHAYRRLLVGVDQEKAPECVNNASILAIVCIADPNVFETTPLHTIASHCLFAAAASINAAVQLLDVDDANRVVPLAFDEDLCSFIRSSAARSFDILGFPTAFRKTVDDLAKALASSHAFVAWKAAAVAR
jgi:hypothetical protein